LSPRANPSPVKKVIPTSRNLWTAKDRTRPDFAGWVFIVYRINFSPKKMQLITEIILVLEIIANSRFDCREMGVDLGRKCVETG